MTGFWHCEKNPNVFVCRMSLPPTPPHLILQSLSPASAMETRRQWDIPTLGWVSPAPSIFLITKMDWWDCIQWFLYDSMIWWIAFSVYKSNTATKKKIWTKCNCLIHNALKSQALLVNHRVFWLCASHCCLMANRFPWWRSQRTVGRAARQRQRLRSKPPHKAKMPVRGLAQTPPVSHTYTIMSYMMEFKKKHHTYGRRANQPTTHSNLHGIHSFITFRGTWRSQ